MEIPGYEITIEKLLLSDRPIPTYRAFVFKVSVIDGVKVMRSLGSPEVSWHDKPNREKVLESAMNMIKNQKKESAKRRVLNTQRNSKNVRR